MNIISHIKQRFICELFEQKNKRVVTGPELTFDPHLRGGTT